MDTVLANNLIKAKLTSLDNGPNKYKLANAYLAKAQS